jgi:Flp pilus assembly protein TadD
MTHQPSLASTIRRAGILVLAVVVSLSIAAQPAFAQRGNGRMQGQILSATGEGLPGVEITAFNPDIVPNTITGASGAGGRWAVIGFARGNWKITFRLQGYVSFEVDVSVSAANRNPDLNITMDPIAEDAGAVGAGAGALDPEIFNEGTALFDAGNYAGAIAKWQEFASLNPGMYQVHGNIGNAHRELGDLEKARASYEALIAFEPANSMANYNIGEMLVEAGDIEGAMPYFESVLQSAPDDPAVYYNVAELYFSQREMDSAITYYKRAIEVDAAYLPAHMQLGFAYINAGDTANAILAFEKYVELAPPDDPELAVVMDVLAAIRSS